MNIGLVIERFDPTAGGAERSTAQIAQELLKRGHKVSVLAGSSAVGQENQGVQIRSMLGSGRFRATGHVLRFESWVREQLRESDFHTSLSVTTNAPARVLQPRGGTAAEVQRRNIQVRSAGWDRMIKQITSSLSLKQWAVRAAERRTIDDPMIQRFVAVSDYVTRQLQEHYRVPREKVVVIPNAATMPVMSDDERLATRVKLRAELGLTDQDVAFVFAAYNPRLKGIDTLLKALALRAKAGGRAVALCAGEFGGRERRLAAALGVEPRLRVLGDRKMPALYVAGDVTVLPTYYDPSSKVVIESLMMGTPAISTLYNGASDMIFERGTGVTRGRVIADPWDERALALAMQDLENDGEREQCRARCAGLSHALSMKVHVDQLERVLVECAG